ncbi:MAG: hypothetical protein ACYDEN_04010, partial [Acidimicrobiales bacterium]
MYVQSSAAALPASTAA